MGQPQGENVQLGRVLTNKLQRAGGGAFDRIQQFANNRGSRFANLFSPDRSVFGVPQASKIARAENLNPEVRSILDALVQGRLQHFTNIGDTENLDRLTSRQQRPLIPFSGGNPPPGPGGPDNRPFGPGNGPEDGLPRNDDPINPNENALLNANPNAAFLEGNIPGGASAPPVADPNAAIVGNLRSGNPFRDDRDSVIEVIKSLLNAGSFSPFGSKA